MKGLPTCVETLLEPRLVGKEYRLAQRGVFVLLVGVMHQNHRDINVVAKAISNV
jgi:hypothetical protein